jgi:hypothetical protein
MYGYPYKICYILLGSGFIFVSSFTSIESVSAEPTLVTGVSSSCYVNKETDGALEANGANTILSSYNDDGGSPGTITIDCEGSTNISISAPVQDTGSGLGATTFSISGLSATATSTDFSLNIAKPGTSLANVAGDPRGKIKVNMKADNGGQVISGGEYKFTVILTVAPD